MAKLLSKRFYIRKLTSILQTISNSCEICHETKPKKRNRSDYVKKVLKVLRPGQGWYCDYLRVSTVPSVWGYNELMVFCDCYSNFCVVAPVMKPTTQQYFLQLLHSHVIQYFGKMSFLYTDYASKGSHPHKKCCFLMEFFHRGFDPPPLIFATYGPFRTLF